MHNYSTTLDKFFDILNSDSSDSYLKCCLVNVIANMVTQNYDKIENENYLLKQEQENDKYRDYLNNEYDRISEDIDQLRMELDNYDFDLVNKEESKGEEEDIELEQKRDRYQNKVEELERINELLSELNYPVYKKEQEKTEAVNNRLDSLESYQSILRDGFDELDGHIRDLKDTNEITIEEKLKNVDLVTESQANVIDNIVYRVDRIEERVDQCENGYSDYAPVNFVDSKPPSPTKPPSPSKLPKPSFITSPLILPTQLTPPSKVELDPSAVPWTPGPTPPPSVIQNPTYEPSFPAYYTPKV